jgi:hypothetical protein
MPAHRLIPLLAPTLSFDNIQVDDISEKHMPSAVQGLPKKNTLITWQKASFSFHSPPFLQSDIPLFFD